MEDLGLDIVAARLAAAAGGGERRRIALPPLSGSAGAFVAAALALRAGPPRIVVAAVPGVPDAERLCGDLETIRDLLPGGGGRGAAPLRVLELPARAEGDAATLGVRLGTVAALRAWGVNPYPCVVAASFPALSEGVAAEAPPAVRVAPGAVAFAELRRLLAEYGYDRRPAVEGPGEWSVRGGIVDFWPPGAAAPCRAEFADETLESLREFDAGTQCSTGPLAEASLVPASGDGAEAPFVTLLPAGSALLAIDHAAYGAEPLAACGCFGEACFAGDPPPEDAAAADFATSPLPGLGELGPGEAHHPELFDQAKARLERHLAKLSAAGVRIVEADALSAGFELLPAADSDPGGGLAVVAKSDRVFARRPARHRPAPAQGRRIGDFEELEPGELVVHADYGVGRFAGSSEIASGGGRTEVFTIEYEGGAKLHVPAAHAHLLTRYVGVRGREASLDRLGGKKWGRAKAAAEKAVADLAAALLETQARREIVPGFAYDVRCEGRDAFDAAFPYEETPDQAAAIRDIERDMASTRPMDRLVCGDAGYGKTEVAMRAAFIAAMNGRQTAVLAPTTVLAEQHFETFVSRFDGTPIRIEPVSRFQTPAEREGTFKRIASGACDIVIGTHAILTERIAFRDLGLVVIDEEQRFGVRHKEFLKRFKATADVLTMSATPIPRTLYLSMTGARDLSLLRTPPRERVAVETSVVRDTDAAVRDAISAELARGGRAFYLHNRIATIQKARKRLEALLPGARIAVAHGRMDSSTLARKVADFARGRYDILLSTTIVESGIDIPGADTIVVEDAHLFGLSDLYQLRGRVGRSSRRGRAVFLTPPEETLDGDARERLAALRRHGGLGAGFGLAVRDLELRGAGSLLGSKQSGHIAAVGFTLYCRLLKRTVAMLKGEKPPDAADATLNLDFIDFSPTSPDSPSAAALPYSYIEEDSQRIGIMRRLAEASEPKAAGALEREMRDRFGPPPPSARRLVRLAKLRCLCSAAGVSRIDTKDGRAFIHRAAGDVPEVFHFDTESPDGRLAALERLMRRDSALRPQPRRPSRGS